MSQNRPNSSLIPRSSQNARPDPELLLDNLSSAANISKQTAVFNPRNPSISKPTSIGFDLSNRPSTSKKDSLSSGFSSSQNSSSFKNSFFEANQMNRENYESAKPSAEIGTSKQNSARVMFVDDSTKDLPRKERGILKHLNPSRQSNSSKDNNSPRLGKSEKDSSSESEKRKILNRFNRKPPSKSCLKDSSLSSSATSDQYSKYLEELNEQMSTTSGEQPSSNGFRSSGERLASSGRTATTHSYSNSSSASYQNQSPVVNYSVQNSHVSRSTMYPFPCNPSRPVPKMGTRSGSATNRFADYETFPSSRVNPRRHSTDHKISEERRYQRDYNDVLPTGASRVPPHRYSGSIVTSSSGGVDSQPALTSPQSSQSPSEGLHPVLTACKFGLSENLQKLLNPRASYDLEAMIDENNNNCLHYAASSGYLDVVLTLIKEDMTISRRNKLGETPIDLAFRNSNQAIADILQLADKAQQKKEEVLSLTDKLDHFRAENMNLQTNLNSAFESLAVNKRNNATLEQLNSIKEDLSDIIEKTRSSLSGVEVICDQNLQQQMFETTTMLKSLGSRCQEVRTLTPTENSSNSRVQGSSMSNGIPKFSVSNGSEIFQQNKRQCVRNGMTANLNDSMMSSSDVNHARLRSKSQGGDKSRNSKFQTPHEEFSVDEGFQCNNEIQVSSSQASIRGAKSINQNHAHRSYQGNVSSLVVEDRPNSCASSNQNHRPWFDVTDDEIALPTNRNLKQGNIQNYPKNDQLVNKNSGDVMYL